jgi:heme exporter protein CcmD
MLELGRHSGFILASYAVTILIMAAFVWQTIRRYRTVRRKLAALSGPDHD